MDTKFYNIGENKKFSEWIMVSKTGSTEYDVGLYYIWGIVNELLETFYYLKKNNSKLVKINLSETKEEYYEVLFIDRAFKVCLDIALSRHIDSRPDSWSLYQLHKAVVMYDWPDQAIIKKSIDSFKSEIRGIQTARHQLQAHTSKKNKPNLLHAPFQMKDYQYAIEGAVKLLDAFVDGEIPYILHLGSGEEYNLRQVLNSE